MCAVTEDVVAVHNGSHIKFVFLKTGRGRDVSPRGGRGVCVVGGRDDLAVVAWADAGPRPDVHVYQYNKPKEQSRMKGREKILTMEHHFYSFSFSLSLPLSLALSCSLFLSRT